MTAKIIDGVAIARKIRGDIRRRVETLIAQRATKPGLAVILVGANAASEVYVRNKVRASAEVGIHSEVFRFDSDVAEEKLLDCIRRLNADPAIHGILVQLPLPPTISVQHVLTTISVDKDVDGFHLYNVGGLVIGNTVFPPCTPYGVSKLLEYENIPVEGRNVTVVGASNVVGKPMALMLMAREATVAICHAKTREPLAIHHPCRHPRGGGGASEVDRAADGAERRRRHRCRHQPPTRWQARRRCRFRGRA